MSHVRRNKESATTSPSRNKCTEVTHRLHCQQSTRKQNQTAAFLSLMLADRDDTRRCPRQTVANVRGVVARRWIVVVWREQIVFTGMAAADAGYRWHRVVDGGRRAEPAILLVSKASNNLEKRDVVGSVLWL